MKKETPFDDAFDFPELPKMSDKVFYSTYKVYVTQKTTTLWHKRTRFTAPGERKCLRLE